MKTADMSCANAGRAAAALVAVVCALLTVGIARADDGCPELLDHEFRRLGGDDTARLCEAFRGKVLLVVNTASKCGYTYQYEGLEQLYRDYRDDGLVVIGFPSNDFGAQEPGSEQQIRKFCRLTYGVQFPMFEKLNVAEGAAHPFFAALAAVGGGYPRWNFHKYLIDRDGRFVASWGSRTEPQSGDLIYALRQQLK